LPALPLEHVRLQVRRFAPSSCVQAFEHLAFAGATPVTQKSANPRAARVRFTMCSSARNRLTAESVTSTKHGIPGRPRNTRVAHHLGNSA
jgi:hypothetical protein